MKIWAFVPAGGVGSRMQSTTPKQYLRLGGKEVLLHAVERLSRHRRVAGVIVGIADDDVRFGTLENCPVHAVTRAGDERARTVLNGLEAMVEFCARDDWVMVHDAARPLLRGADIDRLVEGALERDDGALLGMPMSDTVKRAGANGRVEETLERSVLWRAATPQMFPLRLLYDNLARALEHDRNVTDEAGAMEIAGYRPQLVECASDNIKITTPSDLPLAEWLLSRQAEES